MKLIPYMEDFYNILFAIAGNPDQQYTDLDASQISVMNTLMENATGPAAGRARHLLEMNGEQMSYIEPAYIPGGSAKKAMDPKIDRPATPKPHFSLNPNPAKGYAMLQWDWMKAGLLNPIEINIYDINGRLLDQYRVEVIEENIKVLSLQDYTGGTYLIEVIHEKETVYREKLIVE